MQYFERKKRTRASNWEEEEKTLLRKLVKDEIKIIDSKDCTAETNNMKKEAWQRVHNSFNALNKRKRELKQLTTQWRNTKNILKSKPSQYQEEVHAPGRGPSPQDTEVEIISVTPNKFIIGGYRDVKNAETLNKRAKDANKIDVMSETSGSKENLTEVQRKSKIPENTKMDISEQNIKNVSKSYDTATPSTHSASCACSRETANYEKELLFLAKKAREKAMSQALEEHYMRMEIMRLEKQYWLKKLENENNY